jgi:hypothetical protein
VKSSLEIQDREIKIEIEIEKKKKKKSERKKENSQKRNQNREKEFVRKEMCAGTVGFGCCSILGDQLKRGSLGPKVFISIFFFWGLKLAR